MRQYKERELDKIICNQCGREIEVSHEVPREESLEVEKRWGYFSEKDNEVHKFDLCESCYDAMVKQFRIPVEIER